MKPIIEVNHLSKKYRYGESQPYYTLRDILTDVAKTPFKIFHKNQEGANLRKDEFWALKDVSLKLNRGDVLGVVGPNGSGKSTLLKILSRITPPTSGEAILRGRVGSLLEVGTGFQQELTGRENIYLNGAILGMTRREINRKFDEIVNFSGVEKFIDTPVKHYSSGMYMRLAFSVAAFLESNILLVDEVLAVGDVEFQRKCIGKMENFSKNSVKTIIFISHNLAAVQNLCNKSIYLANGSVVSYGNTKKVINDYLDSNNLGTISQNLLDRKDRSGLGLVKISSFYIGDDKHKVISSVRSGDSVKLCFGIKSTLKGKYKLDLGFSVHTLDTYCLSIDYASYHNAVFINQHNEALIIFNIPKLPFSPGKYRVRARLLVNGLESDWLKDDIGELKVEPGFFYNEKYQIVNNDAPILLDGKWSMENNVT